VAQIVKFLDRIGGTVLLDMSPGSAGVVVGDGGVQAPPPPVERVVSSNPSMEGGLVTLQPSGMRTVTIPLAYTGGVANTSAAIQARRDAVQALMRVLTREDVWLELRSDTLTESRYLHCYRSADPDLLTHLEGLGAHWAEAVVKLSADPYAYGPKESLGTITSTPANDLRTTIVGSTIKGEAPAPLILGFTHPGGGGSLEQFSVWLSSHKPGAYAKCIYDLSTAGGTLPGGSTRTGVSDANALGTSYFQWNNVPVGSAGHIASFNMTGPTGGNIAGKGTYRAFAILEPGALSPPANSTERWRIDLRVGNSGFSGLPLGETILCSGDAYVRGTAGLDRVVDMGLLDMPTFGRDVAVGLDAPATIAQQAIKVYATCINNGGATQANTDLGFDAIVLLPADDALALVQYVSDTTARTYYLDPFVTPGVDTSLAIMGALGGFTDPITPAPGSTVRLGASCTADYWPRYLSVA
jgi:hypothetical protein